MSETIFDRLILNRNQRIAALPSGNAGKISGIFVPRAGASLKSSGSGIYLVGMGTKGPYFLDEDQTMEACLGRAEALAHARIKSHFWTFLDGISWALLGAPYDQTSGHWGWSNVIKIGWDSGHKWPPGELNGDLNAVFAAALLEEFSQLQNSLILLMCSSALDILDRSDLFPALGIPGWQEPFSANWHKQDDAGLWWFTDRRSGNLFIHGYHPGAMVQNWEPYWGTALGCIIHLALAAKLPFVRQ
jgi:hypothetical protein